MSPSPPGRPTKLGEEKEERETPSVADSEMDSATTSTGIPAITTTEASPTKEDSKVTPLTSLMQCGDWGSPAEMTPSSSGGDPNPEPVAHSLRIRLPRFEDNLEEILPSAFSAMRAQLEAMETLDLIQDPEDRLIMDREINSIPEGDEEEGGEGQKGEEEKGGEREAAAVDEPLPGPSRALDYSAVATEEQQLRKSPPIDDPSEMGPQPRARRFAISLNPKDGRDAKTWIRRVTNVPRRADDREYEWRTERMTGTQPAETCRKRKEEMRKNDKEGPSGSDGASACKSPRVIPGLGTPPPQ